MSAKKKPSKAHYDSSQKGNYSLDSSSWYKEAVDARWSGPGDIKRRYPSADIIPGNRIIFNIKGNDYRLIVKIHYNTGIVFIRFVGTHAEYDKVDAGAV